MAETVRVTFLYAIGQQVRYGTHGRQIYRVVMRTYTERPIMSPVVTYRLERDGILRGTAYEADLMPFDPRPPAAGDHTPMPPAPPAPAMPEPARD